MLAAMAMDPAVRPASAEAFGQLLRQAEATAGLPVTELLVGGLPIAPADAVGPSAVAAEVVVGAGAAGVAIAADATDAADVIGMTEMADGAVAGGGSGATVARPATAQQRDGTTEQPDLAQAVATGDGIAPAISGPTVLPPLAPDPASVPAALGEHTILGSRTAEMVLPAAPGQPGLPTPPGQPNPGQLAAPVEPRAGSSRRNKVLVMVVVLTMVFGASVGGYLALRSKDDQTETATDAGPSADQTRSTGTSARSTSTSTSTSATTESGASPAHRTLRARSERRATSRTSDRARRDRSASGSGPEAGKTSPKASARAASSSCPKAIDSPIGPLPLLVPAG